MSNIVVLTPEDLGNGLMVENNKVVVNVAELNIPVDVKLSGVDIDKTAKVMRFTLSSGDVIERNIEDFLAVDTDTTLASGAYASNTITLTDSASNTVTVDLAALVGEIEGKIAQAKGEAVNDANTAATSALSTHIAEQEAKNTQLETKDAELADAISAIQNTPKPEGVLLTSLGGVNLGYLVKNAADVTVA